MSGLTISWVGLGVCCQLVLHDWRVLCPEPCMAGEGAAGRQTFTTIAS